MKDKVCTISEQTIPDSSWLSNNEPRAVTEKVYDKWQEGDALIADFNKYVMTGDPAYIWQGLLDAASEVDITAEELMIEVNTIVQRKSGVPLNI